MKQEEKDFLIDQLRVVTKTKTAFLRSIGRYAEALQEELRINLVIFELTNK